MAFYTIKLSMIQGILLFCEMAFYTNEIVDDLQGILLCYSVTTPSHSQLLTSRLILFVNHNVAFHFYCILTTVLPFRLFLILTNRKEFRHFFCLLSYICSSTLFVAFHFYSILTTYFSVFHFDDSQRVLIFLFVECCLISVSI